MKKVFIAGGSVYLGYLNWFPFETQLAKTVEECDLVFFAGGEDVSPSLYNQQRHANTWPNPVRDKMEIEIFHEANKLGKPKVGVCRGGQFLTVMAGGALVQDMSHPFIHKAETYDGNTIAVTSTHHQQFYIQDSGINYQLLAWANRISPYHYGEKANYNFPLGYKEPEVVIYPDINALAIQPHPEIFQSRLDKLTGLEYSEVSQSLSWFKQSLNNFLQ